MSFEPTEALKGWVEATLPRSTRQVGAWTEKEFGLVYESRSGLVALLHRLGLRYHKPEVNIASIVWASIIREKQMQQLAKDNRARFLRGVQGTFWRALSAHRGVAG